MQFYLACSLEGFVLNLKADVTGKGVEKWIANHEIKGLSLREKTEVNILVLNNKVWKETSPRPIMSWTVSLKYTTSDLGGPLTSERNRLNIKQQILSLCSGYVYEPLVTPKEKLASSKRRRSRTNLGVEQVFQFKKDMGILGECTWCFWTIVSVYPGSLTALCLSRLSFCRMMFYSLLSLSDATECWSRILWDWNLVTILVKFTGPSMSYLSSWPWLAGTGITTFLYLWL